MHICKSETCYVELQAATSIEPVVSSARRDIDDLQAEASTLPAAETEHELTPNHEADPCNALQRHVSEKVLPIARDEHVRNAC